MRVYNIGESLESVADEQLQLTNPADNTEIIFEGADIKEALQHFSRRFLTREFIPCWNVFKVLFWGGYYKSYQTLNSEIDPLTNYDYTEKITETKNNGDITKTHTPDTTHNYVETEIHSDIDVTTTCGTGANTPKTDVYSLAYDTSPKHSSYTTYSGETTQSTKTNGNNNKTKRVDNLKYTDTESHTEITKTIDGTSITADEINTKTVTKHGTQNIDKIDMINRAIELNKISILNEYINHFIDKYTFYVGGDDI